MSGKTIYVCIGESGEYSSMSYVALSAFYTEEEAQEYVEKTEERRRVHALWYTEFQRHYVRLGGEEFSEKWRASDFSKEVYDIEKPVNEAIENEARRLAGPEPMWQPERTHYEAVVLMDAATSPDAPLTADPVRRG